MLKSAVFPYGITLREGGRVDIFPAVEISFANKKGDWLSLFLIIDSGAAISVLPAGDADVFGLTLNDRYVMKIYGIGRGSINGWKHEVRIRLGDNEFELPVTFLDNYNGPRILGREGIFDKFLLIFNESKQRTGFIGENSKEEKGIKKIMDKIK